MKIIGFVGLPGSGKGEASNIARQHGLAVVVMGDVIRQEAARQGLEPTDQNLGRIGNYLRAKGGPDAIAKKTLDLGHGYRKGCGSRGRSALEGGGGFLSQSRRGVSPDRGLCTRGDSSEVACSQGPP